MLFSILLYSDYCIDSTGPFHQRISYWSSVLQQNRTTEMERNKERFQFLKWVNSAFENVTVIPPGTGVMHRVNLEYLVRIFITFAIEKQTLSMWYQSASAIVLSVAIYCYTECLGIFLLQGSYSQCFFYS